MENLIFRGRPDDKNECEQWSLVREAEDAEDYVVQEHVRLNEMASGRPCLRLVKRMTVNEFMSTAQPAAVKRKLQAILQEGDSGKA